MNKFKPATLNMPSRDEFVKRMQHDYNLTKAQAREQYRRLKQDHVYLNDTYQVNVSRVDTGMGAPIVHLSVKRIDKQAIHDWRDMQEIKNQLLGEECEAVELYPAVSRLVDTANQYHMWGVPDPSFRFPVGFSDGHIDYESKGTVVQRGHNDD